MGNLKNIVYISNENYNTLLANGTVTIGEQTITYDSNNVYVVPDNSYIKPASGIPASDLASGVIPDISGKQDALTAGAGISITNNVISATGGGSGGGGKFTITYDSVNETINKTQAEIDSAYQAGYILEIIDENGKIYSLFQYVTGTEYTIYVFGVNDGTNYKIIALQYYQETLYIETYNSIKGFYINSTINNDYPLYSNYKYDLGSTAQSTVTFTLPSSNVNSMDEIYITFKSGSTPTVLNISGNYAGDTSFSPTANTIVELHFIYECGTWVLAARGVAVNS